MALGTGRTGKSLLMQVLLKLGMHVSPHLIPARAANPVSSMEDIHLAQLIDNVLLKGVHSLRVLPLSHEIITSELKSQFVKELQQIVHTNISTISGIWGVKDPFNSHILHLWHSVFNSLNITPIFILCVRNPADSVVSRKKFFNTSESIGELAWLANFCDALHYTGANCFIVHYEDWFSNPFETACSLAAYTGLRSNVNEHEIRSIIDPALNAESHSGYSIINPYVLKLYNELKVIRGAHFDRNHLMTVVKECRQVMDGFKGWYELVYQARRQLSETQAHLKKTRVETDKVKELQARILALEKERQQHTQLIAQIQKLERQLNQLMNMSIT